MPIYEYRCNKCGHKFERMLSVNAPNPGCPVCASTEGVKRELSNFSAHFKGSGFHVNDYPSKGSQG